MVRIQFYPVSIDYRQTEDKLYIQLFGRMPDGRQVCVQDQSFRPYFYILPTRGAEEAAERIGGLELHKKDRSIRLTKTDIVEKKYLGKRLRLIKAYTTFPQDIDDFAREISAKIPDLKLFEHDIPLTRRYLLDKDLIPLILTEAEGDFINQHSRVSVFNATSIEQLFTDTLPSLNVLSIDLEIYNPEGKELDPKKHPIIMASFYSENFKKVIATKKFATDLDYIEFVEGEAELLRRFEEILSEQKPDIILGYNSDTLDFPFLAGRAEKYGIRLDIGLDYSSLKVDRRQESRAAITGISHIDIASFIRKAMGPSLKTQRYDLDSVAKELIGKSKKRVAIENLHDIYDNHPEELETFCEYCLNDSYLSYELLHALLPTIVELVRMIGITPFDITRMAYSQMVEWYLIKRSLEMGELVPNRPSSSELQKRMIETYQGGFVYQPQPGLYKDIVVFDFRSLYPSIISTHNISPDTLDCDCCEGKNVAPGEKNWFCKNKKGFISLIEEELISRRLRINEIIQSGDTSPILKARQNIMKTLANAMYGYLGFYMARWYSIESVKTITSYGRHYIGSLIDEASKQGYGVLYSDTDSVFLYLNGKSLDDAKKFVELFNMDLPEPMELNFEGYYPSGIFVPVRLSQTGAKKRYALLTEDGQLVIKGFEMVRRNTTKLVKEIQRGVIEIILMENNPKKALEFVRQEIGELKNRQVPLRKLIISTELQKQLGEYEAIGPHVAIARKLEEKGFEVGPGTLIKYVICGAGEKIRDKAKLPEDCSREDYDIDYYINNQVIPSVDRIFEALGYTKEDLLSSLDQSKLNSFFG